MTKNANLRTSIVATMAYQSGVLPTQTEYLHHYAYALRAMASVADRTGRERMGDDYRARAYWFRTQA